MSFAVRDQTDQAGLMGSGLGLRAHVTEDLWFGRGLGVNLDLRDHL